MRLAAFESAICSVIRPGHIVLDLASGTGILGLFACRAGARRVYSIEEGGICTVAREFAKANGFSDRIIFIKGFSTHVELPERVDAVVADQIGNFGFNAGVLQYFADARKRFLKPEGVMIPRQMDLIMAPVEVPELFGQVEFWATRPAGFDLSPALALAANTGYQVNLSPENLCGEPGLVARLCLNHPSTEPFHGELGTTISRCCTMHGLGGWFVAQLADGISMTNSPLSPGRIQRRQIYFPLNRSVDVKPGDCVRVRIVVRPADALVNWNVEVIDPASRISKAAFRHSTWKAMLLPEEDLLRTQPEFKPKLVPRGEARRTLVNLCDGTRTVAEIEQELLRLHPELFGSRDEAVAFVAEVVTRYTE
jgi:protein arginine N-methyltransferase 1